MATQTTQTQTDPRWQADRTTDLYIITVVGRWQFVGRPEMRDGVLIVHDASVIRRWGAPLGDLAHKGPHEETNLDPHYTPVEIPADREIWRCPCTMSAWANYTHKSEPRE